MVQKLKANNIALILSIILNIFLLFNLFSGPDSPSKVIIDTKISDSLKEENSVLNSKILQYELQKSEILLATDEKIRKLTSLTKQQKYIKLVEKIKVVDSTSLGNFYVEYETVSNKLKACDTINLIQVNQLQLKDSIIANYKEMASLDSSHLMHISALVHEQKSELKKVKHSNKVLKVISGVFIAVSAFMLLGN